MADSPVLEVRALSKSFGSVQALARVSLSVLPGRVHAVLGENGAGKSTLMNVLSGFLLPDEGHVLVKGREVCFSSPKDARSAGIEMVHQHFQLVPQFTVAENLALPVLDRLGCLIDTSSMSEKAVQIASKLGWTLDLRARVRDLSVGSHQRIEILKALAGNAEILIFDEPTAVLSEAEIDDLLRVLRQLVAQGKSVIYIAHKLNEVAQIADDMTVLSHGKVVASVPLSETTIEQVARWMLGKVPAPSQPIQTELGEVLLKGRGISVRGDRGTMVIEDLDIEVRGGEVLGIGGVDGNGQVELAEALSRIRPLVKGTITAQQPLGYIPQDRQNDGLALDMTIKENLLLDPFLEPTLKSGPFLRHTKVRSWVDGIITNYQVKVAGHHDLARRLSGGNQQKIVVARSLDHHPRTIIAVNPTHGLDFRSAEFVHEKLREVARNGSAVLLISTDTDELAALANRTLYIARGRLFSAADQALIGAAP